MDYHADNTRAIRDLERQVAELHRQNAQIFSRYQALVGQRQNPRLAKTIANQDVEPYYPEAEEGLNTYPIVFLTGNFENEPGVQAADYDEHDTSHQCFAKCVTDQFLPEGSIVEVWEQPGNDAAKTGRWWTATRPCLPSTLVTRVRISGTELLGDLWYPYMPCDEYVPYVIADIGECAYTPYTPDDESEAWFNGEDTYDGWTGFNGEPSLSPWAKGDGIAKFFSGSFSGIYCIEREFEIGAGGGFFQFNYFIDEDLALDGLGPLICNVDGVEVFSEIDQTAGATAGPFALPSGTHTISICIDFDSPSSAGLLAGVETLVVWGT